MPETVPVTVIDNGAAKQLEAGVVVTDGSQPNIGVEAVGVWGGCRRDQGRDHYSRQARRQVSATDGRRLMAQDVKPISGVQFVSPPASILTQAMQTVNEGMAALAPGDNGAIVTVVTIDEATGKLSANAAIVGRVGDHLAITGWIGRTWHGKVVGGGAVKIRW